MQLLNAYIALFTISAGVLVYDAYERQESAAMSDAEMAYTAQLKESKTAPKLPKQVVQVHEVVVSKPAAVEQPHVAVTPKKAPAPYGVFFLKSAAEVPTSDGSRSFRAGSKVQFVRRMDGKVKVSRDGTDFVVDESELTDDANDAAAIKLAANKPNAAAARLYSERLAK